MLNASTYAKSVFIFYRLFGVHAANDISTANARPLRAV
jgi:hypothetical protein